MRTNPATATAALLTALAISLGGLASLPTGADGAYLEPNPPPPTATISSDPVNGSDFTTAHDPDVRNQDGTLIGSGVENPSPGATGKLVSGQFGWLDGSGHHELSVSQSGDGELSELRITPGLGWFWSIDRANQVVDTNLHTADDPRGVLTPIAGEYLHVSVTWNNALCGTTYSQFNVWTTPSPDFELGIHYQDDLANSFDNDNTAIEGSGPIRHDRLMLLVKAATPALAGCSATVDYSFHLRFAFETSYLQPWDGTQPIQAAGPQHQEMRVWVVEPGASQPRTAGQPSDVLYAPVIPVVWVCTMGEAPEICSRNAMASARSGGPKAVVFADPTNGWHTLVMKVYPTGIVQGSKTHVPDPYTSYSVARTKLATLSALNNYEERAWPFAPIYTY